MKTLPQKIKEAKERTRQWSFGMGIKWPGPEEWEKEREELNRAFFRKHNEKA